VNTLPEFAFAEVAVDLEEAAGLIDVCLKDTTLPQPFEFCGGLAVEMASDTQGDLDGWTFSIFEGADNTAAEDLVCSGTTDAEGVLSTCLDGNSNEVDLTTLAPGDHTIQEGTPTSGFFNSDPGPIPTTTAVTKNAEVTVGGTTP
jgi:hypothetical protein